VREAALDRDVPHVRTARVDREDVVDDDRAERRRRKQDDTDGPDLSS
jgi:hypothetical protein